MSNRAKQKNIIKAIFTAQGLIDGIKKDSKNPFAKNRYASLEAVLATVLPVLRECDILMMQYPDVIELKTAIVTEFTHVPSGESITSTMMLPDIPDPQKVCGGITYFKRYMLIAQLGLATVDDDGVEASNAVKIEEFQKAKEESKLISAVDLRKITGHSKYCDAFKDEILKALAISELSEIKNLHTQRIINYVAVYGDPKITNK